jgi:hypothetical protein
LTWVSTLPWSISSNCRIKLDRILELSFSALSSKFLSNPGLAKKVNWLLCYSPKKKSKLVCYNQSVLSFSAMNWAWSECRSSDHDTKAALMLLAWAFLLRSWWATR